MAQPRTISFGNFVIYLGDGADPENFTAPCGFTEKSLKLTSANSTAIVPDCDDPDAAPWTMAGITSISAEVTGSGVLSMADLASWRTWFLSGADKDVRVMFNDTGANGGGYWQGPAILTDFTADVSQSAEAKRAKISVTIKNDGAWAWTDNA